ncbi:MAG: hypothetical protein QF535_11750 [Anaerolineales bacterium]|nr:hypothetical protein [Anaerolineales bacterium]
MEGLSNNPQGENTPELPNGLEVDYRIICSNGQGSDYSLTKAAGNLRNNITILKENDTRISRLRKHLVIQLGRDDLSNKTKEEILALQEKLDSQQNEAKEVELTLEGTELDLLDSGNRIMTNRKFTRRFSNYPALLKRASAWINTGKPNFYLEAKDGKMTNVMCASDSWGGAKTDYWKGGQTEMHNVAKEFEGKPLTTESLQQLADTMEQAYKIEFKD